MTYVGGVLDHLSIEYSEIELRVSGVVRIVSSSDEAAAAAAVRRRRAVGRVCVVRVCVWWW